MSDKFTIIPYLRIGKFLAIFLLFLAFTSTALALNHYYPATIEKVIDGDIIIVDLHLGLGVILDDQYIRFYGIDAWETRGEEKDKGLLAKAYVEERLVSAATVEIEIRPEWGRDAKGKYGRWLGVIWVDGENINQELVDQGHAQVYLQLGNQMCPSQPKSGPEEIRAPPEGKDIVYITDTGTKYHRLGCPFLRQSCIPISRSEAMGRGYTPCKRCSP